MSSKSFKIDQYQSELGEIAVKKVFESFYNIKLRKVSSKSGSKIPDFEILNPKGEIIAVCEVKSLVDVLEPLDLNEEIDLEALSEKSQKRDRNHRSKLREHHAKALSQLTGYPNIPKLIVFVSFDMTDHIDMLQVLQEFMELYPNSPMADLYTIMKVHQSIVPSDNFEIKYTIDRRYTTESGKNFGDNFLSVEEALERVGKLPVTFSI